MMTQGQSERAKEAIGLAMKQHKPKKAKRIVNSILSSVGFSGLDALSLETGESLRQRFKSKQTGTLAYVLAHSSMRCSLETDFARAKNLAALACDAYAYDNKAIKAAARVFNKEPIFAARAHRASVVDDLVFLKGMQRWTDIHLRAQCKWDPTQEPSTVIDPNKLGIIPWCGHVLDLHHRSALRLAEISPAKAEKEKALTSAANAARDLIELYNQTTDPAQFLRTKNASLPVTQSFIEIARAQLERAWQTNREVAKFENNDAESSDAIRVMAHLKEIRLIAKYSNVNGCQVRPRELIVPDR